MRRTSVVLVAAVTGVAMLSGGCVTGPTAGNPDGVNLSSAQRQALVGALLGGAVGAVAGNNIGGAGDREKGALIGAAVGGLIGHTTGTQQDQMNQQQQQIQQLQIQAQVTTIWLQNSNGSKSPVTLTKAPGGQWIGPKGEYYDGLPTQDQLRRAYGF